MSTTHALQAARAGDPRWAAVAGRARAAGGPLVYAPKTTGVSCRPSAASRQPKRESVVFYSMPDAAEAAGFRACRRCRPKDAPWQDPALERVRRTCALIDRALEEGEDGPPSLGELAAKLGTGPHHLL